MEVSVKYFGMLRLKYSPNNGGKTIYIELDDESTLAHLIKKLNIQSMNEIGFISVNGRMITGQNVKLKHMDEVMLYSHVFGG